MTLINEHDLSWIIANEMRPDSPHADGADWALREGLDITAVLTFGQQQTNAIHVALIKKLGLDEAVAVVFAVDLSGDHRYLHANQDVTDELLRGGFANSFRVGWECHKAFKGERE